MNKNHLIALCCLALLASGCSKEQPTPPPASDVSVTKKDDAAAPAKSDKDEKASVAAVESEKALVLPAGFPPDIPVMPGSTVKTATPTKDGLTVQFTVASSVADATKFYEKRLRESGWGFDVSMGVDTSKFLVKTGKGDFTVEVLKDGDGSTVQVLVPKGKS